MDLNGSWSKIVAHVEKRIESLSMSLNLSGAGAGPSRGDFNLFTFGGSFGGGQGVRRSFARDRAAAYIPFSSNP